jgi:hypothetical protein
VTSAVTLSVPRSLSFAQRNAGDDLHFIKQAYAERQGPQADMWRSRVKSSEKDLEQGLEWLIQNNEDEQALRFVEAMDYFWTTFGEVPGVRQKFAQVLASNVPELAWSTVVLDHDHCDCCPSRASPSGHGPGITGGVSRRNVAVAINSLERVVE